MNGIGMAAEFRDRQVNQKMAAKLEKLEDVVA